MQHQPEHEKSAYQKALERWEVALEQALAIVKDPFKAPELNVFESRNVLEAAWDIQVEYAALNRARENAEGKD